MVKYGSDTRLSDLQKRTGVNNTFREESFTKRCFQGCETEAKTEIQQSPSITAYESTQPQNQGFPIILFLITITSILFVFIKTRVKSKKK